MLGFIVPVKAKSTSHDWERDNELLRNTLQSLCNQDNPAFKIFVVYTDMPYYIEDVNVTYIQYPFDYVKAKEMSDYEDFVKPQFEDRMAQGVFDKGKRISYACRFAKMQGCTFIMSVDSDDLVSNKIASYINEHKDEKYGWYVDKGFIQLTNSKVLIKVPHNMNHLNGSTNIAQVKLIPDFSDDTKSLSDVSFFIGHGYMHDRILQEYNDTIKPLPFYAIIYVLHGTNWSTYDKILKTNFLKTMVKFVTRGKWLSKKIKKEFGIKSNVRTLSNEQ